MDSLFDFNDKTPEKPIPARENAKLDASNDKTNIPAEPLKTTPKITLHLDIFSEISRQYGSKSLHHAIIFHGVRGIGKKALVEAIALEILVKSSKINPSQVTQLCAARTHSDFLYIESKNNITVDEIREICHFTSLTPSLGNDKVVIIDGIEYMNNFAANAILKSLEDAQKNTYFLMISHDISACIDTIRSRSLEYFVRNTQIPNFLLDGEISKLQIKDSTIIKSLSNASIGLAKELINADIIGIFTIFLDVILAKDLPPSKLDEMLNSKTKIVEFSNAQKAILLILHLLNPLNIERITIPANYPLEDKMLDLCKKLRQRSDKSYIYKYFETYDRILVLLNNKNIFNIDATNTIHASFILIRRWIC